MVENKALLLQYNLQFFADGEGGEKTEQPTSKKLSDARKEGKVAKSKEVVNGIALFGFFLGLRVFTGFAGFRFEEIFSWIYSIIPDVVKMNGSGLTINTVSGIVFTLLLRMLIILLPFLIIGFLTGFVANLVQVGWQPTLKPLQPKLNKFNPVSGFKRIFSKQSIVNLLMALAKLFLVFYISYLTVRDQANNLFVLYDVNLMAALNLIFRIIVDQD